MLEPRNRQLLLEALRPPPGYSLDKAIGTSYSLDLLALLTAPLAFTFFDWETEEGRPTADPLALLEAVRRNADKIDLFCQAGRISAAGSDRPLLVYLEDSVHEVRAPRSGGLFHPKVWVLRYSAASDAVRYRLLCLTRNLTFDASWDTALVLEGELESARRNAFGRNHPVGDFLNALPAMAIRSLSKRATKHVTQMAKEVRKVRFELPEGFEDLDFKPLGIPGYRKWPFPAPQASRRMLVASPFLGPETLARLAKGRDPGCLISRAESLAALDNTSRADWDEVLAMSPDADPEDDDQAIDLSEEDHGEVSVAELEEDQPRGLHAKLYVMDDGWDARVWTGSANATRAAFSQNVEFLVELVGAKSFCGIDALLGADDQGVSGIRSLLEPFKEGEPIELDPEKQASELLLEQVRLALACVRWRAKAEPESTDSTHRLVFNSRGKWPALPAGVELAVRPVTLGNALEQELHGAPPGAVAFTGLPLEKLTGFFLIRASVRLHGAEETLRFVVNVPLEGAPEGRREHVLRSLLADSAQVLRLIWLLLAEEDVRVEDWVDAATGRGGSGRWGPTHQAGMPLLEPMLKALSREPAKLDQVARLVADLRRTPEGSALLPQGFEDVWDPVWKARQERCA